MFQLIYNYYNQAHDEKVIVFALQKTFAFNLIFSKNKYCVREFMTIDITTGNRSFCSFDMLAFSNREMIEVKQNSCAIPINQS